MYMHLAWNDWLYSSMVTVRTCRAHWNPFWCSSHTYCWSSSTFQLWSVCFEIFFLNITHSSSYLHIHLSISANYGKQVFSNMHTDRKLSRNYTCYPDASVLCSLYSKGLWKANVIVMDNSMEVMVLDKYSMPFNEFKCMKYRAITAVNLDLFKMHLCAYRPTQPFFGNTQDKRMT